MQEGQIEMGSKSLGEAQKEPSKDRKNIPVMLSLYQYSISQALKCHLPILSLFPQERLCTCPLSVW